MIQVKSIADDSGDVMAPIGCAENLRRGRWRNISIVRKLQDDDLPEAIRQDMVSIELRIIFTHQQLKQQGIDKTYGLTPGTVFAYVADIATGLVKAGKQESAQRLRRLMGSAGLDLCSLDEDDFVYVD